MWLVLFVFCKTKDTVRSAKIYQLYQVYGNNIISETKEGNSWRGAKIAQWGRKGATCYCDWWTCSTSQINNMWQMLF